MLETSRLLLRPLRPSDLDAYARWHADPELMQEMGREAPLTRVESRKAFARHLRHWDEHGFGLMAVEDKSSGDVIGRAGLHYHRLWPADPEVGWLVETPWQGQGFATEAGRACVRWGFDALGFGKIVSICTPSNVASRRVMEKLGFEFHREVTDPLLAITLRVHALSGQTEASVRT